jgi:hypothetical protein
MFPEFHKDTIREIAINATGNRNLIISGGSVRKLGFPFILTRIRRQRFCDRQIFEQNKLFKIAGQISVD